MINKESVIAQLTQIPYGTVTSYKEMAIACGSPRGAQVVGWMLATVDLNTNWHRVVNSKGRLSINNMRISPEDQAIRLREEGVLVLEDADGLYTTAPIWSFPAP